MILKSSLGSAYTVTSTASPPDAAITGLQINILEDGFYHIIGNINVRPVDSSAATARIFIKLAIDGTAVLASGGRVSSPDATGAINVLTVPINNFLYLKKDQVITVLASMDAGDNSTVEATGTTYSTYIEAINLTKLARGGM